MVNNIQKFFTYLGFNDTCINAEQLLCLLILATQEESFKLQVCEDELDITNNILRWYIDMFETNGFRHINEYMITEKLANL